MYKAYSQVRKTPDNVSFLFLLGIRINNCPFCMNIGFRYIAITGINLKLIHVTEKAAVISKAAAIFNITAQVISQNYIIRFTPSRRYLLVQSRQWKQQNNLFKVNN